MKRLMSLALGLLVACSLGACDSGDDDDGGGGGEIGRASCRERV